MMKNTKLKCAQEKGQNDGTILIETDKRCYCEERRE